MNIIDQNKPVIIEDCNTGIYYPPQKTLKDGWLEFIEEKVKELEIELKVWREMKNAINNLNAPSYMEPAPYAWPSWEPFITHTGSEFKK